MKLCKSVRCVLACLLTAALLFFCCVCAFAETTGSDCSGYCGRNVYNEETGDYEPGENICWVFDAASGTLTISGRGDMAGFAHDGNVEYGQLDCREIPWSGLRAQIRSVVIEKGVETIGKSAFEYCTALSDVALPNTLSEINDYAFYHCESLEKISLSRAMYTTGWSSFEGSGLRTVTVPEGIRTIGERTFACCTQLTSVSLPSTLEYIEMGAFMDCSALTSLKIPDGVDTVYGSSFAYCTSLETVELPAGLKEIDSFLFLNCTSLRSITVPEQVTQIRWAAFEGCTNLQSLILPDSVRSIEDRAFRNCTALKAVHIPSGAATIGDSALEKCSALEYICSDSADCTAAAFAAEHRIEFRVCAGHGRHTPGDSDGDGFVDLRDVTNLTRYLAGGWGVEADVRNADVDGNGKLTLKDLTILRRYIAGWDVTLK